MKFENGVIKVELDLKKFCRVMYVIYTGQKFGDELDTVFLTFCVAEVTLLAFISTANPGYGKLDGLIERIRKEAAKLANELEAKYEKKE
jgi:hypothetical protein